MDKTFRQGRAKRSSSRRRVRARSGAFGRRPPTFKLDWLRRRLAGHSLARRRAPSRSTFRPAPDAPLAADAPTVAPRPQPRERRDRGAPGREPVTPNAPQRGNAATPQMSANAYICTVKQRRSLPRAFDASTRAAPPRLDSRLLDSRHLVSRRHWPPNRLRGARHKFARPQAVR